MSNANAIVLVTDRPDRSCSLAERLNSLYACRTIGVDEPATISSRTVAIVADVRFHLPSTIECLRRLVACLPRAVFLAMLRNEGYLERVQAAAVGATLLLPSNATFSQISAALRSALRSTVGFPPPSQTQTREIVEQAKNRFSGIFAAARCNQKIDAMHVKQAVGSIISALAESGIRQWLEMVWQYDDRTYQHCLLVTGLAAEFARTLKFSAMDQELLTRGALLHDIGKARVPLSILNKADSLTAEETAVMRTHPSLGWEMLRAQGNYSPELLEVVLRHHEMLDGSGYPDGIAGARISDLVRLVTVCDIYAALIEHRPYRQAMGPAQAFKILQDMKDKLDPVLLRAFGSVAERSDASLSGPAGLSAA